MGRPLSATRLPVAIALLVVIVFSAVGPVSAGEGAPANDQFANATNISPGSLPYSRTSSSLSATNEGGEPISACGNSSASVWYHFVPSATGTYRVDTIGSNFDPLVDVFRGTALNNLVSVDCNDNIDSSNPDLLTSRIAYRGVAGQHYYIRVTWVNSPGFSITLNLRKVTAPANDNFANATTISALPFDANANNINATTQATEPGNSGTCGAQGATRWYKYTPEANEIIWANTFVAADFNTMLGVYTGPPSALTVLYCNDDQWTSGQTTLSSGITFRASAGVTYRFQVGGRYGESGEFAELPFHVRRIAAPEPNDAFANATQINSLQYSDPVTLRKATTQTGEPLCWAFTANTTWYRFTPSSNAGFQATTSDGYGFVGMYRSNGPGMAGLQFMACGSSVGHGSPLAGTTYYFQVTALRSGASYAPALKFILEPD